VQVAARDHTGDDAETEQFHELAACRWLIRVHRIYKMKPKA
jgi:hypothetical protein